MLIYCVLSVLPVPIALDVIVRPNSDHGWHLIHDNFHIHKFSYIQQIIYMKTYEYENYNEATGDKHTRAKISYLIEIINIISHFKVASLARSTCPCLSC